MMSQTTNFIPASQTERYYNSAMVGSHKMNTSNLNQMINSPVRNNGPNTQHQNDGRKVAAEYRKRSLNPKLKNNNNIQENPNGPLERSKP